MTPFICPDFYCLNAGGISLNETSAQPDSVADMSRTPEQLKAHLKEQGITMLAYSKQRGVDYILTSKLINGSIKGRYGKAHEAATKLGLKVAA
jgi:gp16 family phage-associated protein